MLRVTALLTNDVHINVGDHSTTTDHKLGYSIISR